MAAVPDPRPRTGGSRSASKVFPASLKLAMALARPWTSPFFWAINWWRVSNCLFLTTAQVVADMARRTAAKAAAARTRSLIRVGG